MNRYLLITSMLVIGINASASKKNASEFKWHANDATVCFQSAVTYIVDTIIVDKQASDWIVRPNVFYNLTNKTIIFEPGVVFRAKEGAFIYNGDCLLKLIRCRNITIVGYGATFKMNRDEYAAYTGSQKGEWRMSISISNCNTIKVFGLKLIESGGDGVFISGDDWYGDTLYSQNIVLKDLWCDKHYRQGISVASVQNLLVQNCWFTNTSGALPMSGVDLEPDRPKHRMNNVVFENCRFTGNDGNAIQLAFHKLNTTTVPIDVTFRNCYTSGNHKEGHPYSASEIDITAADRDAVTGLAKFENCVIENSLWSAVTMRKPADSYLASFNNCAFLNVSQKKGIRNLNCPVFIQVTDYSNPCPRYGGAAFKNCLISYNTEYPFVGTYGNVPTSPGLGNVQLHNITVIHPNSKVTYNSTAGDGGVSKPSTDCVFNFKHFTKIPATTISINNSKSQLLECEDKIGVITASRSSRNISFPLAVVYDALGTASAGDDYSLLTGSLVIQANSTNQTDSVFVRNDTVTEPLKTISVKVQPSVFFPTPTENINFSISDCIRR